MPAKRREFVLVLLAGAVGAGLVVLAVRQAWAQAIFTPPRPLPAQDISVSGQQLVPLASALALAALACLAAVIATRSVTRRAAGALLAALGAVALKARLLIAGTAAENAPQLQDHDDRDDEHYEREEIDRLHWRWPSWRSTA